MPRLVAEFLVRKGLEAQPHGLLGPHEAHGAGRREQVRLQGGAFGHQAGQRGSRRHALAGFGQHGAHGAGLRCTHDETVFTILLGGLLRKQRQVAFEAAHRAAGGEWQGAQFTFEFGAFTTQGGALPGQRLGGGAQAQHLFGLGLHLGLGNELLRLQRFQPRQGLFGQRQPLLLQPGFAVNLCLFEFQRLHAALQRQLARAHQVLFLARRAFQAAASLGQAALHLRLGHGFEQGAVDADDEQHVASLNGLTFCDAAFEHGTGGRRDQADQAAIGNQHARRGGLACVLRQ